MTKGKATTVSVNGTSISLKLFLRGLFVAAVLGAGWADLRGQISTLREEVKRSTDDRWRAADDLGFMLMYSDANELQMVPHPAAKDGGR